MTFPSIRNLAVLAAVATCAFVAGCSKKEDGPADVPAVLTSADSVLRYIPADTPYAVVNAEPIDDDIVRKMTGETSAMISSYEIVIQEAFRDNVEGLPEDDPERQEAERMAQVLTRVLDLFSLEGMRKAGFDINESVAFYGHGLLPVLRASLTDADSFEAAVAALEADAGEAFEQAELGGQTYRYADTDDGARVILGAFGDYVVLTIAPDDFTEAELTELIGLELPAESLADSGGLREIAAEYGFTSHYLGFVDIRRIASTLVEERSGLDARLLATAEMDPAEISDVCRAEIMEVANIAPRAVFGYSKIERDGVEGSFVVELRDDIAAGLMTLTTVVPGLGSDLGGLLSFGFGIDPTALREFYSARLDALEADPFDCEYFDEVQAGVEQGRAALAQPLPPVAYGFRGVVGVIDDVDMDSMMRNQPPSEVDASFMVAIENAPQLMMMGSMFSPELAELQIQADGKPVALDVPQAGMLPSVPFAAMTDDLLALSIGAKAETRVTDLMTSATRDPSPMISVAGDAGRYYEMVGMSVMQDEGPDEMSEATREAVRDSMMSLGEVYDRIQFNIHMTTRGVEIDTTMSFKD